MVVWFKEIFTLAKLLFVSRPKDKDSLELMQMRHFPSRGYLFLMWCGKMVYRADNADYVRATFGTEAFRQSMTHETIHLLQAQRHGSWVAFYLRYVWEWVKGNPFTAPSISAYYTSPYEMEAYGNEYDRAYAENYDGSHLRHYDIKHRKATYRAHRAAWRAYCRSIRRD